MLKSGLSVSLQYCQYEMLPRKVDYYTHRSYFNSNTFLTIQIQRKAFPSNRLFGSKEAHLSSAFTWRFINCIILQDNSQFQIRIEKKQTMRSQMCSQFNQNLDLPVDSISLMRIQCHKHRTLAAAKVILCFFNVVITWPQFWSNSFLIWHKPLVKPIKWNCNKRN